LHIIETTDTANIVSVTRSSATAEGPHHPLC